MEVEYSENSNYDDDQESFNNDAAGEIEESPDNRNKAKMETKVREMQKIKIFTNDQKKDFVRA